MQIAIIRDDMASMKVRLTSIDNRVALVHTDLVNLSERLDRLENRMSHVENRVGPDTAD
jgi:predicted  nucleic acid-binding Zn-ribbon protein